jgi:PIN domain nuclease of toxin-antitoxin system
MTRYLLDTHVWLWFTVSPHRLSGRVQTVLLNSENEVWLSVASVWELAVKVALGKLILPKSMKDVDQFVATYGQQAGLFILPIEVAHATAVATLPALHSDPFDRLLVCQSRVEEMVLVTADVQISQYPLSMLWAV